MMSEMITSKRSPPTMRCKAWAAAVATVTA